MKEQSLLPVRILLWLIAAYHLVAGFAATFSQDLAVKVGGLFFGVNITLTPQAELLIRYLGAFGIAFGVMALLASIDPVRNKAFLYGAIIYFVVRAFDRVMFASLMEEHAAGPMPNWARIIVILLFAAALVVCRPREKAVEAKP